ncbi:AraC family transcriptional regulator [Pseudoxanthomonas sangjuensis]|uniref:AraC family transcriptional regulator n=1 Tax=Pseudoxanthomonas sangjuensis TaxID=1503750 RepID=UPI001390EEBD|nr:AraC family transcriptional regulator [Pseudoxanthomonas sangjuensis]KAF1707534.1 AraC family transcriptional regulator [Pseudoxanthomonas sangjuensis]
MALKRQPVRDELSATVPISIVNGFLSGADRSAIARLAERSGIPPRLLGKPGARVTQEQFSTLYRLLAIEFDDEMPGIFSRPLRSGALKFLCLSLLDAPRLEVALHRFCQFFRLVLDDLVLTSGRGKDVGYIELVASGHAPAATPLGKMLMLKLAHGVASWLVRRKMHLDRVSFDFAQPSRANDYLYLFPGPVLFSQPTTRITFPADFLELPVRQRKPDLRQFLDRAPEDWIFVSFAEELTCHRVRQCIVAALPDMPTIHRVARNLHCSDRTLFRRLSAEGTTFQAIKDEVRRDIAIRQLTQTQAPISQIAEAVGFDNPTAFHRAFRGWTGSTPSMYRHKG